MLIINFSIIVIILLIGINSISSHYIVILIILIVKWALQAIITTIIHQTSTPTIHQPTLTPILTLTITLTTLFIINPNIPLYLIITIIINLMKFQCHPSNNTANTNTMMIVLHSLWILMLWVMILEGFWLTQKIRSNYVDYWVLKLIQTIKTYNNIIIITTIG